MLIEVEMEVYSQKAIESFFGSRITQRVDQPCCSYDVMMGEAGFKLENPDFKARRILEEFAASFSN